MTTLKEVFQSDNWIITKILQGKNDYRVDAKRRFHVADKKSFFSKWGNKDYINRLAKEYYGKNAEKFNCFYYE